VTRLAIVSDTHLPRGERVVPARCLELCRSSDAILHAGDLSRLSVLEELRALGPPLHAIHGNADEPAVRALLPARLELEFGELRVAMVHNGGAATGRLGRLRTRFPGVDAVIFGHSHVAEHEHDGGFQIFNPGSPTERRRRTPALTMGLARIRAREIRFEIVTLG
jgi:uncharacterized protein